MASQDQPSAAPAKGQGTETWCPRSQMLSGEAGSRAS